MTSERDQVRRARGDAASGGPATEPAPWLVDLLYDELPAGERSAALARVAADPALGAALSAYRRIREGAARLPIHPLPIGALECAQAAAAKRAGPRGSWWDAFTRWLRGNVTGPALASAVGAALVAVVALQVAPGPGPLDEAPQRVAAPAERAAATNEEAAKNEAPSVPMAPVKYGDVAAVEAVGAFAPEPGAGEPVRTPAKGAAIQTGSAANAGEHRSARVTVPRHRGARPPVVGDVGRVKTDAPTIRPALDSDDGLAERVADAMGNEERVVSNAGGRDEGADSSAARGATPEVAKHLMTEGREQDAATGFDGARAARWRELRRRLAKDELAAAERLLRVIIADEGESASTRAVAAELSHAKSSPLPDKSEAPAGLK